MPNVPSSFATLSAENIIFGDRKHTPLYYTSLGFRGPSMQDVSSRVYLGPLDVDYINQTGVNLDAAMNWGFSLMRLCASFTAFWPTTESTSQI